MSTAFLERRPGTPKWVPGLCKGLGRWEVGSGGRGVLVVLQRHVPVVRVVHFLDGAPDPVHRQSADFPVAQQRPLTVEIPQVQFLDKVLTCPLPCTSGVRQNPHVFLNKVADVPVAVHVRRPSLHSNDVVVDVPVVQVVDVGHSAGPVPVVLDVARDLAQRVDAVERCFDGLEQTVGQHCLHVSALEGSFRELEELGVCSHDQLSSCVGEGARFSHELGLLQEALADRSSELSVLQCSFGSALLDVESFASRLNPVVLVLGSRVS